MDGRPGENWRVTGFVSFYNAGHGLNCPSHGNLHLFHICFTQFSARRSLSTGLLPRSINIYDVEMEKKILIVCQAGIYL